MAPATPAPRRKGWSISERPKDGEFPSPALSLLSEYLDRVAPRDVAQTAHRERRAVARQFLAGLHEDFSNLERLARMIAALSPVISGEQETERLILGLKFRLLYARVWLRLSTGREPLEQLEQLTSLVGRLATRMEQAMAAVSALSVPGLNSSLNGEIPPHQTAFEEPGSCALPSGSSLPRCWSPMS